MKIEPCVSKPRMKMESPVAVLPFSPSRNVTPGVLRSACRQRGRALLLQHFLADHRDGLRCVDRACVNFGDETRSTFGVVFGLGGLDGDLRHRLGFVSGLLCLRLRGGGGERQTHGHGDARTRILGKHVFSPERTLLCLRALAIPFGSGWRAAAVPKRMSVSATGLHRIANHSCLQPRMIAIRDDTYLWAVNRWVGVKSMT